MFQRSTGFWNESLFNNGTSFGVPFLLIALHFLPAGLMDISPKQNETLKTVKAARTNADIHFMRR